MANWTNKWLMVWDSVANLGYRATPDQVVSASAAAVLPFTPYSTIAATNVQTALEELTDEKANLSGATFTGLITSNGQVKFPATQNPSADANTLDDYEEGTWTPTATAQTTPPTGVTYSSQVGNYTKLGNVVHVWARVALTSKGSSGVGNILIGMLPFTVNDPGTPVYAGPLRANSLTFTAGYTQVVCAPVRASTNVAVIEQGSGVTDQNSVWANVANTSAFILSASYFV
jgi:hypothetical protein